MKFTGAQFYNPASNGFSAELYADGGLVSSPIEHATEVAVPSGFAFPAFRDGHAHPLFAGREAMGPVVTAANSISQIQQILIDYRKQHPNLTWIEGGAYDRSIVEGGKFLASWLDEAIPDVPVILHASDHHTIWVNSKALEYVPSPLPTLQSGSIDSDGSKPTGVLREPQAMALVLDRAPAKTLEEEVSALVWADKKLASFGVVQAQDAWITKGMTEVYIEAIRANALELDYNLAFKIEPDQWRLSLEFAQADREKVLKLESEKLSAKTVKFFADGVFGSGTASVLEAYDDDHSSHGEPLWSDQDLFQATALASELGFQLHIHAIGDAGVRQALDAIEYTQQLHGKPTIPNVIAHAELISDDDIPRFAQLGVVANMQPLWAQADGMLLSCVPRLGKARIDQMYRMRDLLDSGATISFGSDWPVSSSNPVLGIATAVTRQTADLEPAEGWTINQALSVSEAIESYTSRVQFQLTGEVITSLSIGQACDFVVLDQNPLTVPKSELRNIRALATYKNSKQIF